MLSSFNLILICAKVSLWGTKSLVVSGDKVTEITNTTISTTNIIAENLKIKAANVDGSITANKLTITKNSTVVFNADADKPDDTQIRSPYSISKTEKIVSFFALSSLRPLCLFFYQM